MPRSAATTLGPFGIGQVIIMRPARPARHGALYMSSTRHADPTLVTTPMLEAIINAIREDDPGPYIASLRTMINSVRQELRRA